MARTAKVKVAAAALLLAAFAAALVPFIAAARANAGASAPHTNAHHSVRAHRDCAVKAAHARRLSSGQRRNGFSRPAHELHANGSSDRRVDQSRPPHNSRVFLAAFRGHKAAGSEQAVKRQIAHHLEPALSGLAV